MENAYDIFISYRRDGGAQYARILQLNQVISSRLSLWAIIIRCGISESYAIGTHAH